MGGSSARRPQRSVTSFLAQLLSFETVFTLFLFAGLFKADPRLAWVPFDITAAFFALSVVAGSWILLRRRFAVGRSGLAVIAAMTLFGAWLAFSLLWSEGRVYAPEKALHVFVLNGWALAAAAVVIAPSTKRRRRFLACIVAFAFVLAVEGVRGFLVLGPGNFLRPFGGYYIGIGRVLGLAACITVCFAIARGAAPRVRFAYLSLAGLFFFVMLIAGARGPLVASALGLALLLPFGLRPARGVVIAVNKYLPRFLILATVATVLLMAFAQRFGTLATTLTRLRVLFTAEGGGASAAGRLDFYGAAVEHWLSSPLIGHGSGMFPILYGLGDVRGYPHNIFLEVLVETGGIGMALLLVLLALPLLGLSRRWPRWQGDMHVVALVLVFVVTLLNAQISGDLTDNRPLFMAVGLLAGSARPSPIRAGEEGWSRPSATPSSGP